LGTLLLAAPAHAADEMAFLAMRSAARHRLEIAPQLMPDFACQDLLEDDRRRPQRRAESLDTSQQLPVDPLVLHL
jgi:hypothetical protein